MGTLSSSLYERDFFAWTQQQARLIKEKDFTKLDLIHLQEELYLMGVSERRELNHRLEVLLMHLLKWKYQPSRQCKSWERPIKIQRLDLIDHLEQNPSLKAQIQDYITKVYEKSLILAAEETGLEEKSFPEKCEWTIEQILNNQFFPN